MWSPNGDSDRRGVNPTQTATGHKHMRVANGRGNLKTNNTVKVKFTLEQATKAQRGTRRIALLFL
jgi:hypothetical protein